jgi:hypothetical protein
MNATIQTTGDAHWDAVAAAVGTQAGDILNTETRDGETFYNINFPKLPDGTGYGGLFLGVPASVVTIS